MLEARVSKYNDISWERSPLTFVFAAVWMLLVTQSAPHVDGAAVLLVPQEVDGDKRFFCNYHGCATIGQRTYAESDELLSKIVHGLAKQKSSEYWTDISAVQKRPWCNPDGCTTKRLSEGNAIVQRERENGVLCGRHGCISLRAGEEKRFCNRDGCTTKRVASTDGLKMNRISFPTVVEIDNSPQKKSYDSKETDELENIPPTSLLWS